MNLLIGCICLHQRPVDVCKSWSRTSLCAPSLYPCVTRYVATLCINYGSTQSMDGTILFLGDHPLYYNPFGGKVPDGTILAAARCPLHELLSSTHVFKHDSPGRCMARARAPPHMEGMYMSDSEEAIWMVSSASKLPFPHDCSTLMISGNSVASSCVLCLCIT